MSKLIGPIGNHDSPLIEVTPLPLQTHRKCADCGREFLIVARYYWIRFCTECEAKRETARTKYQMEEKARYYEARWNAMCPPLFRNTDEKQLPQRLLTKVLSWEYNPIGQLLSGGTGLAKTRCMYLLLKKMIFQGRSVRVFGQNEFESLCISKILNRCGREWIESVRGYDVILFDDLLRARLTPRVETELFHVLDFRYNQQLPILATTNHSIERLGNQLGQDCPEAFVRRLLETTEVVQVPLVGDEQE